MTVDLIISTDPLSDCDDFLGLAVLHALMDRGECNILAIIDCTSATNGIAAIDAINTYYKHDIPLGKWTGASFMPDDTYGYGALLAALPHRHTTAIDAVTRYRAALAAAADGSVVVVTLGPLNVEAALLASPADAYSSLTAAQLVAAKVSKMVCMGGHYPSGAYEMNFSMDYASASAVMANWPTPIHIFSFELGYNIDLRLQAAIHPIAYSPTTSPIKVAHASQSNIYSWGSLVALYAVRGTTRWFTTVQGTMTVGNNTNTFTAGAGNHYEILLTGNLTSDAVINRDQIAAITSLMLKPACRNNRTFGLAAGWNFDGGRTIADFSGNGNTATEIASTNGAYPEYCGDGILYFRGYNSGFQDATHCEVSDDANLHLSTFTVGGFCTPYSSSQWASVVAKGYELSNRTGAWAFGLHNSHWVFRTWNSSNWNTLLESASPNDPSAGAVYHFVIVNDYIAGHQYLYINGVLTASNSVSFSGVPASGQTPKLFIGGGHESYGYDGSARDDYFNGAIWGLRMFDYAMSSEEIEAWSADTQYADPANVVLDANRGDWTLGTCALPDAMQVAYGVDVGATTGTAVLTNEELPANFADLNIDSSGKVSGKIDWSADVSNKPTIGTSNFNPASDTVKLDAAQSAYAPAKAGDAMALTAAYNAAKTASQAGDTMSLQTSEHSAIAAALMDLANAVDGKTPRQALQIITAILAGKISGASSGTETFRGLNDQQDRVVVTADAFGNRTSVVYQ